MIETQEELDRLLDEVKRCAARDTDRAAAAERLLEAAEALLEVASALANGVDREKDDAPVDDRLHAIPALQQRGAHRAYGARRVRDAVFADPTLFGEPAWDMLLDLLAAQGTRKRISVTSACLASNVPLTTALRWITVLESKGLVEREEDEMDARRTFLKLTRKARGLLRTYFVELGRRKLL